ncbi:MAG: hypothetical protein FGF50_04275 [Candidatus Brockarchaeota archaeon]|nr:hypothetical protein [Candidatus Brockarchaeota archaeon]
MKILTPSHLFSSYVFSLIVRSSSDSLRNSHRMALTFLVVAVTLRFIPVCLKYLLTVFSLV